MATRIRLFADVSASGPLFDGQAKAILRQFFEEAKRDIAQQGVDEVRARLDKVTKEPTGHYRRHIHTITRGNAQVVTDSGIIYGPWLEGTSKRNNTTRFKGYTTFRKIRLKLRKLATPIAQAKLDKYLARLR